MKYIFLLAFFLLSGISVFAQIDESKIVSEISANKVKIGNDVGIEEIFLAKDDGSGNAGDKAENFSPTDIPIYCIVQLDSMKSATVKMNLVAVKVKGVKPETKVFTVSYKTNGVQSRVSFKGAPEGKWVTGNYRFDIFIDGKPAGEKSFEIQTVSKTSPKSLSDSTLGKRLLP